MVCKDYMYDAQIDRAVLGQQLLDEGGQPVGMQKRHKREDPEGALTHTWVPTTSDLKDIDKRGQAVAHSPTLGLRGMSNLGNTCFMSCVLQAMVRLTPLQEYFLGDRHSRHSCRDRRADPSTPCLGCEMRGVFDEVFAGSPAPVSPLRFLAAWWRIAASQAGDHLACYEQQDAHEFYLSAIAALHCADAQEPPLANGHAANGDWKRSGVAEADCRCVVHRIFTGSLRSDLICRKCGHTSSAFDPCVDVSLNILPPKEKDGKESASSLIGCLRQFTRPEPLQQRIRCQRCDCPRDCVKQMSIQRLPPVLCFHIKRFEHSSSRQASRKVSWRVKFPLHSLKMGPFVSAAVLGSRYKHSVPVPPPSSSPPDASSTAKDSMEYELVAVVAHTGQLEGGHYVAYVQLSGRWYKCDDSWIVRVHESTVRACEAYLLYYACKPLTKTAQP